MPTINLRVGKKATSGVEAGSVFTGANSAFYAPMTAAWGIVTKRDSKLNLVDVLMAGGVKKAGIKVASRGWAGKSYGERNLPPLKAMVLILFTNRSLDEGIVIASALAPLASGIDQGTLAASSKEDEELQITPDGWNITHDRSTGNWQAKVGTGPDIQIDVKKSDKTVKVLANTTAFEVDSSGNAKVSGGSGKKVTLTANNATIEIAADGKITVTAASSKAVDITAGSNADVNLAVSGTGKVVLAGGTLGCNDFVTCLFAVGAPHSQGALTKVLVP